MCDTMTIGGRTQKRDEEFDTESFMFLKENHHMLAIRCGQRVAYA